MPQLSPLSRLKLKAFFCNEEHNNQIPLLEHNQQFYIYQPLSHMLCSQIVIQENKLTINLMNKKHLKNVGPICHCEPPHAALPFTRCNRLHIDVHNNDDNDDDNA